MKIKIKGITNEIIIGCYEHERKIKQPIVINVEASLYNYDWVSQDKLITTVNYDELIEFIQILITKTEFHLLESLLQYLAKEIMLKYNIIKSITLNAMKPQINEILAKSIKVSYTKNQSYKVALALGSNSDYLPAQQLVTAIEIIGEYVTDIEVGGFYETKPQGFTLQNNFHNTAIIGYTELKPEELFGKIKSIEKIMGKKEIILNGPRVIDIDLIFFSNLVYKHNFLSIPHYSMHLRDFVLKPLIDIDPEWCHPIYQKSIKDLYNELEDKDLSIVKKYVYLKNI